MKTLLRLNHWQIFALIYGIPLLTIFVPFRIIVSPSFKPVLMVSYVYLSFAVFAWPFTIGTELAKILPSTIAIPKKLVTFQFVFICVFIIPFSVAWLHASWINEHIVIFLVPTCYYLFATLTVVRYASKVVASVELGREARVSEYAGYFIAIWFSLCGCCATAWCPSEAPLNEIAIDYPGIVWV